MQSRIIVSDVFAKILFNFYIYFIEMIHVARFVSSGGFLIFTCILNKTKNLFWTMIVMVTLVAYFVYFRVE